MKNLSKILTVLGFVLLFSMNCFAGSFINDGIGIRYDVGGGRYLENGWAWADASGLGIANCYYFNQYGYIYTNTATPDGQFVDAAGRLVVNGIVQTKAIAKYDYELVTASYLAVSSTSPESYSTNIDQNITGNLVSRMFNPYNAAMTTFTAGSTSYPYAIELTEQGAQFSFNSGYNSHLTFDITGDYITDEADYVINVYRNGRWSRSISHRFVDLVTETIYFDPHENITIEVTTLNDYMDRYVRRIYIFNSYFA